VRTPHKPQMLGIRRMYGSIIVGPLGDTDAGLQ
jgi:hypothetical protein